MDRGRGRVLWLLALQTSEDQWDIVKAPAFLEGAARGFAHGHGYISIIESLDNVDFLERR
jgi:hypothetical protein